MKKILLFTVLILLTTLANSAIWRVNNFPNAQADFVSLTEAVAAASNGDIIYLEGTGLEYNEGHLTIDKSLTIYGSGFFLNENEGLMANKLPAELSCYLELDAGSEGTTISGLRFRGGYLYILTSEITIERCRIDVETRLRGWDQDCSNFMMKQCYVYGNTWMWDMGYASNNIVFTNNVFYTDLNMGKELGNYIITNNIFAEGYWDIIAVNAVIQNNIVGGIIYGDVGDNNQIENNIIGSEEMPETGENNLIGVDLNDLFVDYPSGENTSPDAMFELVEASVAQGHGVGGIDCGIFDGNFPYILSGLPPIPRVYESNISGLGTPQGLHINLKAKSQH